jgi:hypothetical protein
VAWAVKWSGVGVCAGTTRACDEDGAHRRVASGQRPGDASGGRFAGALLDQAFLRRAAHDQRAALICGPDSHRHHGRVQVPGSGCHDADYL